MGNGVTRPEYEILRLTQILPDGAQLAVLRLLRGLAVAFRRPAVSATQSDPDLEAALAEEMAELLWTQTTRDRPCIGCSACGHCTLIRVVDDLPPRPLVLWCPACSNLEAVALGEASLPGE